jgi:hypothetical protein
MNPQPTSPTFTIGDNDTPTSQIGFRIGLVNVHKSMGTFEHKKQAPISAQAFKRRAVTQVLVAFALLFIALGIGVLGYHFIAGFSWIDALLDASMILGGMGPVRTLESDGAKVFASSYALFSGLVFIGVTGFVLAPFFHRMLHRFHYDEE